MTAAAPAPSWLTTVADEVGRFDRSSTAERVADLLRRRITEGDLAPGSRLSEEQLVQVLKVSRNTLREAFRFLAHEGLLVHVLHRGVFVTELDEAGVVDLYCVRRMIECTARLLAELRLAFGVVSDPKVLHEKYIARNKAVLSLLRAGKLEQAADELAAYLRDSEQELLNAIRGRDAEANAAAPFTPSTKGAP
jgi:DNA-binding GntR family transcriptional regulator